ncbi:MAG: phosphate signaling complex protein PhoU [Desulfobacterales bacterium]|nr:phosphate signaling complex protein PhoU [Desulfobacterales bacterium]
MAKHFHKELEKVKKRILSLGTMVEERLRLATDTIENLDTEIAKKIIATDYEIDEMEVEVEEECLKILALYQPVAVDLRFIIAAIKINNDLERIADEAANIAQRVITIAGLEIGGFYFDYGIMAEKTQQMLKMSLDSMVNLDVDVAFKVVTMDDEVDEIHRRAYDAIKLQIQQTPNRPGGLINLYLISRHLERIADHTTNIAEEVIYMIEGEIIRHGNY